MRVATQDLVGARLQPGCCSGTQAPVQQAARPPASIYQRPRTRRRRRLQLQGLQVYASLSNTGILERASPPRDLAPRDTLRLAIPSKGRMAEDTLTLLQDCQLKVNKPNPRQYSATMTQMPQLEVWFQRASDVVRKLMTGDVELGIVGRDMYEEISNCDPQLLVVHDALNFGHCHLGLGVPMGGKFVDVHTIEDLRRMPDWTETQPMRVVTGYHNIARRFFEERGFQHVVLLSADGALEAAPLMGSADIILDLVSTGITLRENNLKELDGGRILDSQGVLVANRRALETNRALLNVVHELVERFEAHLKAEQYFMVIANMRGQSQEEVAARILEHPDLRGLQGPTISTVYTPQPQNGAPQHGVYACVMCIPKSRLYKSMTELRQIGGSGVLVQNMTYIFDEEPPRWRELLETLGLQDDPEYAIPMQTCH